MRNAPYAAPPEADSVSLEDHLELLAEISDAFARSRNINETLRLALSRIMNYLDAEAASLFLLQKNDSELVCRACAGPIDIDGMRLPAAEGVIGRAIRENTTIMVRDVSEEPSFAGHVDRQTGFVTRSILCAPLRLRERRIGAIELVNKKSGDPHFDTRDRHLLAALAASASMVIHNATLSAALVEHERLQKEIELAAEIQRNLLPAQPEPGYPVHGINVPAREVSGDFYDHFALDDGRILFNLADVSGKGINAALLMAKTSSLFHCLGKRVPEPAKLLAILNNEIYERSTRGMFVTMVGGLYDPARGELRIANAGHQPPLLVRGDGSTQELTDAAPPLGVLPDQSYPETRLSFTEGNLYIYSDGLTEARLPGGGQLGVDGVRSLIGGFSHLPAMERLWKIVHQVQAGAGSVHDDITLLLVEAGIS